MGIILTIIGLIGLPTIYLFLKKVIFGYNIEFFEIIKSFPFIPNKIIKDQTINISNLNITQIGLSKEFQEYVEEKKIELDNFYTKLERFKSDNLIFKKKEIQQYIKNILRILDNKSTEIEIETIITKDFINQSIKSKKIEWTSMNYYMVYNLLNKEKELNKLYVYKKIKF